MKEKEPKDGKIPTNREILDKMLNSYLEAPKEKFGSVNEVERIIKQTILEKDNQFKALLDSRIAELDGAHIWRGERCTTEERDFAIDRLEELLKEMIK